MIFYNKISEHLENKISFHKLFSSNNDTVMSLFGDETECAAVIFLIAVIQLVVFFSSGLQHISTASSLFHQSACF